MPTPVNPATVKETNDLLGQQSVMWKEIAASTKMMAENLSKLAGGMRDTTSQMQQQYSFINKSGQQSVKTTNDLAAAQANAAQNTDLHNRGVRELTTSFDMAGTALERFKRDLELDEAQFGWFEITDGLRLAEETARGVGRSMSTAFTSANAKLMSLVSGVGSLVSGLFDIGTAILSLPFSFLAKVGEEGNKLLREKGSGGGGGGAKDNSFRDALEEVKEKLGDISVGEGKMALDMYNNLNKSQGNLAGTGRTLADVFGKGADALKAVAEVMEQLGPLTQVFGDEIVKSADSFMIFQRGLGLSADDMKAFGATAMASGKKITDVLEDASRMALTLGNKFGISAKLIAKDMAYMSANTGKFGMLSTKALGAVSTYIRKLGVDIKALEGVMGVFDDFESGTQAAAKLSSAFGVQIDSMKMMKAQNPAEQIQMLRDAFAASGKSLDGLSRQQLKYLQDTTGLGEDLQKVMSGATEGVKLGDMEAAAADAASDTNAQLMTQGKILKDLAAGIKKLYSESSGGGASSMSGMKKEFNTFIDAFKYGLEKGIRSGEAYDKMVTNITQSVYAFGETGKNITTKLREMFGIDSIFKGVGEIFDPKNIEKKGDNLVKIFENLFEDLKNPATAQKAFHTFFDAFTDWFETLFDAPGAKESITKAVEDLVGYMGNALSGATDFIMTSLTDVINAIVDFLSGNDTQSMVDSATQTGIGAAIKKAFIQLGDTISANWPKLKEALIRLLDLAVEALKPYALKLMMLYFGYIIVTGFIGGMAAAAGSALMMIAIEKFAMKMKILLGKRLIPLFGQQGKEMAEAAAQGADNAPGTGPKLAPGTDKAAGAGQTGAPTKGLIEQFKELSAMDIIKAAGKIVLISVTLVPALTLLLVELAIIGKIIMSVGITNLIVGLLSMGAVILALAGLVQMSKLLPTKAQSMSLTKKLGYAIAPIAVAGVLLTGISYLSSVLEIAGGIENILLTLGALVSVIGAVALIGLVSKQLNAIDPVKTSLALLKGVPVLAVAAVLAAAVGVLSNVLASIGVTPDSIMSMTAAMVAVVGAIGLIALAGIGLAAVAPDGGVTAATAITLVSGSILVALTILGGALWLFTKVTPKPETIEKAVDNISMLAKAVGMVALIIGTALLVGLLAFNPFTAAFTIAGLAGIAGFLLLAGPVLGKIISSLNDIQINDSGITKKVELLQKVFSMLDPLFGVVKMVINNSKAGWFQTPADRAQAVKDQLDSISAFFSTVMTSLSTSITVIFDAAARLPAASETDMKKAEMVAKLLDPIANLISSLMTGIQAFSGSAEERSIVGTVTKVGISASEQLGALKSFLLGDGDNGFFHAIVNSLPTVMNLINGMTKEMKPKEVEAMTKRAEMVAQMVGAVGEMANVFSTIANAAASLGQRETERKVEGVLTDETMKRKFVDMNSIVTFMRKDGPFMAVLDALMAAIPDLLSKFEGYTITGDSKTIKDKADSVGHIVSALASSMGTILGMAPSGDDMTKASKELTDRSGAAITAIDALSPGIGKIIDAFNGVTLTGTGDEIKAKVKDVQSVIEATMSVMNKLMGMFSIVSESRSGGLLAGLFTGGKVVESFKDRAGAIVEVVGSFSGVIKTFVDKFNEITIPGAEAGGISDKVQSIELVTRSMMSGINRMMDYFKDMDAINEKKSIMESSALSISQFMNAATTNLTTMLSSLVTVPVIDDAKFNGVIKGIGLVSDLGDYTESMKRAVNLLETLAVENFSSVVTEAVKSIKEVDKQLGQLENIRMDGRIEKVGKALALRPDTLKIDNKPVNVNVQLNLTIDASDLAMEVTAMQTKLVSTSQITNNPFSRVATTPTG